MEECLLWVVLPLKLYFEKIRSVQVFHFSLLRHSKIVFFKKPFFFSFLWPHCAALGILVPQPGIEPVSPAMEVWSLNHWITRGVAMIPFWSHLCASFLHPELLMKKVISHTSTQRLFFLLAPTSPVDNPQYQFYLVDYTQEWYCCHHENCGAQENSWLTQISQFGSRICCPLIIC